VVINSGRQLTLRVVSQWIDTRRKRHSLATPRPSKVIQICFRFSIFNFWAISLWCSQLVLNFADWAFFSVDLKILNRSQFFAILRFDAIHFPNFWHHEYSKLICYPFGNFRLTQEFFRGPFESLIGYYWICLMISRIFIPQYISIFCHFLDIRILKFPNHWISFHALNPYTITPYGVHI